MNDFKEQLEAVAEKMSLKRLTGTVRRLKRSYGFIRVYPKGEPRRDYFFHWHDLLDHRLDEIETGDIVSFEAGDDEKGLRAVSVKVECERHLHQGGNDDNE